MSIICGKINKLESYPHNSGSYLSGNYTSYFHPSFNARATRIMAVVFPTPGAPVRTIIVILFLIGQSRLSRFRILERRIYILQPILSLVYSLTKYHQSRRIEAIMITKFYVIKSGRVLCFEWYCCWKPFLSK